MMRFGMSLCLLLGVVTLSGCVAALPKPYVRPPEGTRLEDREKLFAQKEVRHVWSAGYRSDGIALRPPSLAAVYQASGDSTTAKAAVRTNVIAQLGAIVGVGGMAYGLGLSQGGVWAGDRSGIDRIGTNVTLISAGAVLLLDLWAQYFAYPSTARSYNRYLAQDLGLDTEGLQAAHALPAPPPYRKPRPARKAKVEAPQEDAPTDEAPTDEAEGPTDAAAAAMPTAGAAKADDPAPVAPAKAPRPFWAKSWYVDVFDLGVAAGSYPSTMEAKLDAAGALPAATRGRIEVNVLGLYWPLGAKRDLLVGGMWDSTGDGVTQGNKSWSLYRELYALSTLYFPFGKIGDQFFLRGDLGVVQSDYSGQEFAQAQNGWGAGLKVGIGYAVPLGNTVRPMLNFDYAYDNVFQGDPGMDLGTYQGINFDIGVLW